MPDDAAIGVRPIDREVVELALVGLLRWPKTLPAKLFYDEAGCRLFYRITELPEYYLTRTERVLLAEAAPAVLRQRGDASVLVEYGASDEAKALHLLTDPAGRLEAYVPVDVAAPALQQMRVRLRRRLPALAVHPVAADFLDPIALPPAVVRLSRLGFFPGSTIGNLDPAEATSFLAQARITLGAQAQFLVGADMRKDPAVLLPAYDDAAGVTAAFNRNMLVRLNRDAGADFDPARFAHRAVWNDAASRIEMHLVSRLAQTVHIGGQVIHFTAGESIHTENSYKHTPEALLRIAAAAGWTCRSSWFDPARWFGLFLLE